MNMARGFIVKDYVPGQGEVVYSITQEGIDHLKSMTSASLLPPPAAPDPARAKMLVAMEKGFPSAAWSQIFSSRNHMYQTVRYLTKAGHKIQRKKSGQMITYVLEK